MLNELLGRAGIAQDLVHFLWREKMWWFVPMVIVLLVLGVLFWLAQGSALAPFIYTLF